MTKPTKEEIAALERWRSALDDAEITPEDISLRKPTLNDAFLTLTGHAAEEAADEEDGNGQAGAPRSRRKRRRG